MELSSWKSRFPAIAAVSHDRQWLILFTPGEYTATRSCLITINNGSRVERKTHETIPFEKHFSFYEKLDIENKFTKNIIHIHYSDVNMEATLLLVVNDSVFAYGPRQLHWVLVPYAHFLTHTNIWRKLQTNNINKYATCNNRQEQVTKKHQVTSCQITLKFLTH